MQDILLEIIAKLLEDAKRIQQLEPNAGTEARIKSATSVLRNPDDFLRGYESAKNYIGKRYPKTVPKDQRSEDPKV